MSHSVEYDIREPLDITTEVPKSVLETLQEHAFFANLDPGPLHHIADTLQIFRHLPGDIIIQEDTLGQSLFFVIKGVVSVYSRMSETTLAELGPCAFFGEIGALYEVPRTASIISKTFSIIAALRRDHFLEVMRDHPDSLHTVVNVAKTRYLNTRPRHLPLGHRTEISYQLAALKNSFPFCEEYNDSYLEELLVLGKFRCDRKEVIVMFSGEDCVVMIISGSLIFRNPAEETLKIFESGEIVEIPSKYHPCCVLVSSEETIYFKVEKSLMAKLASAAPLEPEDILTKEIDHISINEEIVGPEPEASIPPLMKPSKKKHSISTILYHDQHVPLAQLPLGYDELFVPQVQDRKRIQNLKGKIRSIFEKHNIDTVKIAEVLPNSNYRTINFNSIVEHVTDTLVVELLELLGNNLEKVNLSRTMISDEAILFLTRLAPSLISLNLEDCVIITQNSFHTVLDKLSNLEILNLSNCPGFDAKCVDSLFKLKKLRKLSISYCRNVGDEVWKGILGLSQSLEALTMHRLVGLDEECILTGYESYSEPVTFPFLSTLDLTDCAFITTQALRLMLKSIPNLKNLNLSFCTGLDDSFPKALVGVKSSELATTTKTSNIVDLDLSFCQRAANDRSIDSLIRVLPHLKRLSINGCKNVNINSLEKLKRIPTLKHLNVSGCSKLPSDQVKEICNSGNIDTEL